MIVRALVVVALLAAAPTWAINKCKGPDGKVTYQEGNCPATDKGEKITIVEPSTSDGYGAHSDTRIRDAMRACSMDDLPSLPEIGWTEEKFLKCSRRGVVIPADKVNVTRSASGIFKQFVYRDSQVYVYTQNGVVTSIQSLR